MGKGTRVALLAPNGPEWIVGWLAATRIGALVTLLNTYDKERELGWLLRHADVQVLLTVDHHLGNDYLGRLEHRVADPATGEELPVGRTGELWVRGYSLMLELYKRERADVFTPDGWCRTSDGGRFDSEGHLHFTGRLGTQIKTSGMNVTPREVEIAIEQYPEVSMAFVTGIPDDVRGEDVAAAVLLVPGADIDGAELRLRLE